MKGGGIRLGSPSITSRGMREPEMEQIGAGSADILSKIGDTETEQRVRKQVAELAARFPIYEARMKGGPARTEHARVESPSRGTVPPQSNTTAVRLAQDWPTVSRLDHKEHVAS